MLKNVSECAVRSRTGETPRGVVQTESVKQIQLITDGACLGNPGPGGWAAILRYGPNKKEVFGFERHTTNNRMELTAAIEGLRTLKEQLLWVRVFQNVEELRGALAEFRERYNQRWIVQRLAYLTPARARQQLFAIGAAA